MTINIPDNLAQKLKRRAREKNFASVDEYITSILEEVSKKLEAGQQNVPAPEEEEQIKEQLRDLGYL